MKYTQGHELAELAGSQADFGKQQIRHKNRNHGELVPTIRTKWLELCRNQNTNKIQQCI